MNDIRDIEIDSVSGVCRFFAWLVKRNIVVNTLIYYTPTDKLTDNELGCVNKDMERSRVVCKKNGVDINLIAMMANSCVER